MLNVVALEELLFDIYCNYFFAVFVMYLSSRIRQHINNKLNMYSMSSMVNNTAKHACFSIHNTSTCQAFSFFLLFPLASIVNFHFLHSA